MKYLPITHRAMDLTLSGRVFNMCWLSAGFGLAMLQMLLLAQAWRLSQKALVPALLASAWALGSLVGSRFSSSSRLWGCGCLAGTLLVGWHVPLALGLPRALVDGATLALLAVLLGACGSAWLTQPRPWPAAGEKTVLVRSLVGLTVGLLVAWMLPAWAGFIAPGCFLPLLVLETFLSGRAPLAPPAGKAARWMDRCWRSGSWTLQLERRGLLPSRHELARIGSFQPLRATLPLAILASTVAVVLGSVWGAIPTPFAASLRSAHTLDVLSWLLGGQLVALALGTGLLLAAHNGIGFPARLLPCDWQLRVWRLALLMPLVMAASLAALGLPALQARWWLAVSLGSYTLADAVWGILLPRLLPDLTTVVQSQGFFLLERDSTMLDPVHLAYARAGEAAAKGFLARAENLAIVVWTPLLGWLIDRLGSVDAVLVMVGVAFALGLLGAALVWALIALAQRPVHRRASSGSRTLHFSGSSFPRLETTPLP